MMRTFFGKGDQGGYEPTVAGLWMRDGTARSVRVPRHPEAEAEI